MGGVSRHSRVAWYQIFQDSDEMGKVDGKGSAAEFDEQTLEVYKECFRLMDIDKDGVINKNDLRAAFDNVGRLMSDAELDEMLREIGGQCNYDNMIKCFEAKMSGGVNDSDDVIINAIKSYDEEIVEVVKGQTIVKYTLDTENFRHVLMSFGDKLTQEEIDDMFSEFEYDEDIGAILTKSVVDLFVAGGMDEKEEEKKEEEKKAGGEEKAGGEGGDAEGGKKKKKKKKAAK